LIYKVQKLTYKWVTITTTDNLNVAINLLRWYDRDGEIAMRIVDGNDIGVNIPMKVFIANNKINWKKEGF